MKTIVFRIMVVLALVFGLIANLNVSSVSANADAEVPPQYFEEGWDFYCDEVPCNVFNESTVRYFEDLVVVSDSRQMRYDGVWDIAELTMRPAGNVIDGQPLGDEVYQQIPARIYLPKHWQISIPQMGIRANEWQIEYDTYDYWGLKQEVEWLGFYYWYDEDYFQYELENLYEDKLKTSYSWDGTRLWVWRWFAQPSEYHTIIYVADVYFVYRSEVAYDHGYLVQNWQDMLQQLTWPAYVYETKTDQKCQLYWATGIPVDPGPDNITFVGFESEEFWYETENCDGEIVVEQTDRQGRLLKTQIRKDSEGFISLNTGDGIIAYNTILTIGENRWYFVQTEAERLSGFCTGEFWYEDEAGYRQPLKEENILRAEKTSVTLEFNQCNAVINFNGYKDGSLVSTFSNYYLNPSTIDFADANIDAAHITSGGWSFWLMLNPTTTVTETVQPVETNVEQDEPNCKVWYTSQDGTDGFEFADYYEYVPRDFIIKWANCENVVIKADGEMLPIEESTHSQAILHFEDNLTGHLFNKFDVYDANGWIATFFSKEKDNLFVAFLRKWGPTIKTFGWPWWLEASLMLILFLFIGLFLLYLLINLITYLIFKIKQVVNNYKEKDRKTARKIEDLEKEIKELRNQINARLT